LATLRKGPGPGQRDAVLHPEFREDLRNWVETERRTALRVLTGVWSCRLTQEHRLVYLISADRVDFLQARYHYWGCSTNAAHWRGTRHLP
jgi:toxin YoeB